MSDSEHLPAPEALLAELAQAQFGAFTREQALDAGVSARAIEARLARGEWRAVHPRVYRAATTRPTRGLAGVAARLHYGEHVYFSHLSAADLHAIDTGLLTQMSWLTVPHARALRPRPGVVLSRSRHLDGFTTIVRSQPVMNLPRTLVDLAQVLDETGMRRTLYDVSRRTPDVSERVLACAEGLGGRTGLGMLRRVLGEFDPLFESGLEYEADGHLRAAGVALVAQYEVWDEGILLARLDFADPELRVGIEIDGHRAHAGRAAMLRDRRRDRELARRGWTILRFVTEDVRRTPRQFVRDVLAQLEAAEARQVSA